MKPVYRYESSEEPGSPFPSLAAAMQIAPQTSEARIATSFAGVTLAEAGPVEGSGTLLCWSLTHAGRDVQDYAGWTAGAPTLSPEEYDAALAFALAEDFARAS